MLCYIHSSDVKVEDVCFSSAKLLMKRINKLTKHSCYLRASTRMEVNLVEEYFLDKRSGKNISYYRYQSIDYAEGEVTAMDKVSPSRTKEEIESRDQSGEVEEGEDSGDQSEEAEEGELLGEDSGDQSMSEESEEGEDTRRREMVASDKASSRTKEELESIVVQFIPWNGINDVTEINDDDNNWLRDVSFNKPEYRNQQITQEENQEKKLVTLHLD